MKRYLLLTTLIIFATVSYSQKIQFSTVREQNSNKRPLPLVQVIFTDAVPVFSDQLGNLRFVFKDKKTGDLVFLTEVSKAGYELVNNKEIEHVKLSSGDQLGVDIILAKVGVVDAAKKEYYDISDKSLKAGLEREKVKIRKELQDALLSAQQFSQRAEQLQKDYDNQKRELDQLAEKFARVNFDDVEPIYQEALELFKAGKIDEAIAKLESATPLKLIEQMIEQEKQDADDQAKLNARKQDTAKSKQSIIAQIRLLTDMYGLKFNPAKAESLFDGLLRLDSTDLNILQGAADFYSENHCYEKALHLLPLIIAHPQVEESQKGNSYKHIGDIYSVTGQLEPAMQAFLAYQKTYADLLKDNPRSTYFKNSLAISYNKLGWLQSTLGNLDKALTFHEDNYRLVKELYEESPQNVEFKKGLAISYQYLGATHSSLGNLDKALAFYQEFARLMKELSEAFPQNVSFKNGLAISYFRLGEMHALLGNLDKTLAFYEERSKLGKELYEAFPQNVPFKNGLALSYEKLGETHASLGDFDKALTFYEEETTLFKELYETFPQNVEFKHGLAISYSRRGDTHISLGNMNKALIFHEEYNRLVKELYEAFPQSLEFKNGLAISYQYLGFVNTSLGNLDKALSFYEDYNHLAKELHEAFPQNLEFKKNFTLSYGKLGNTHASLGNLDKALTFYEDYNRLAKELYEAFPQNLEFKNAFAESYYKLGEFSKDHLKDKAKARAYFKQVESLWIELMRDAPQYAMYKQNLDALRQALSNLDNESDMIFLLKTRIRAEPDTLTKYQLYGTLCDSLRRRVVLDQSQKPILAEALNSRAWFGFFLQRFEDVEADVREGIALNTDKKLFLTANLAPALLLQGKYEAALAEYQKWKDQSPWNKQGMPTYSDAFIHDLKAFEKAGIIPQARMEDVAAVRKMLLKQ